MVVLTGACPHYVRNSLKSAKTRDKNCVLVRRRGFRGVRVVDLDGVGFEGDGVVCGRRNRRLVGHALRIGAQYSRAMPGKECRDPIVAIALRRR